MIGCNLYKARVCSNAHPFLYAFLEQVFEKLELSVKNTEISCKFYEKSIDLLREKEYTVSKWSKRVVKWSKVEGGDRK